MHCKKCGDYNNMARKKNINTERELTYKESRFVDEYIANAGNATQAYCKAYQKENTVTNRVEASRKLKNPNVQREIQIRTEPYRLSLKEEEQTIRKRLMAMIDGTDASASNTDIIRACDVINRMSARYLNRTTDETNKENALANMENDALMDIINKNPLQ